MKALILDDDKKICNLIKSLLENYFVKTFHQIDTVFNTKDAITAIQETDYDLFLFEKNQFDSLELKSP